MKGSSHSLLLALLVLSSCRVPSSGPTAPISNGVWQQLGGTSGLIVTTLADIDSGKNVFAGSNGEGVYHFAEGGANMVPANNGLTNLKVQTLGLNPTTLFAGTIGSGVYRSLNNAVTWGPVNAGMTTDTIQTLYVSDALVFAGAAGAGIYRSTDNGITWQQLNAGLTSLTVQAIVRCDTIFLAGTAKGVFSSSDSGNLWNAAGPTNVSVLAFAVIGNSVFAGTDGWGVLVSTNDGTTWNPAGLSNSFVQTLAQRGNDLFAGTPDGVFLSSDLGTTWRPLNTGFVVNALAVGKTMLYAGTEGNGVWYMALSDLPQ